MATRKSAAKIMQKHPGGSKTIKREVRKKTATIVEKEDGTMRYRFPMPDKAHARNALARLPLAKGLTAEEKAKVKRRAERILAGSGK
jgi:hypothetical protein